MNVVHLSTSDLAGGAARGAYWLHKALQRRGVKSQMLVDRKASDDASVIADTGPLSELASKVRARLDQVPLRRYRPTGESYWTVGWVPHHVERMVETMAPDIVHIHWTGNGFLPISALNRLRVPIVWTLRDMWAFTGGCHYTNGCKRYQTACGACPQLRSARSTDLSRRIWRTKRRYWCDLNLWLVPISQWLADCTRSSALFPSTAMQVIPNGIEPARFRPLDKQQARRAWGLADDRDLILFGAFHPTNDPRKGFGYLRQSLCRLAKRPRARPFELIVFGGNDSIVETELGVRVRHVGRVDNDEQLTLLYSSADVIVAPSLQEAFGKTLIEAMACERPVVAFDCGGPGEIIDHRLDGYLAEPLNAEDLATGIAWCLADRDRARGLGQNGRQKVERQFDIDIVAGRYEALYEHILEIAA